MKNTNAVIMSYSRRRDACGGRWRRRRWTTRARRGPSLPLSTRRWCDIATLRSSPCRSARTSRIGWSAFCKRPYLGYLNSVANYIGMALTLCDGSMTPKADASVCSTWASSQPTGRELEIGSVQPYLTGRLRDDGTRKSHAAKFNHPEVLWRLRPVLTLARYFSEHWSGGFVASGALQ